VAGGSGRRNRRRRERPRDVCVSGPRNVIVVADRMRGALEYGALARRRGCRRCAAAREDGEPGLTHSATQASETLVRDLGRFEVAGFLTATCRARHVKVDVRTSAGLGGATGHRAHLQGAGPADGDHESAASYGGHIPSPLFPRIAALLDR